MLMKAAGKSKLIVDAEKIRFRLLSSTRKRRVAQALARPVMMRRSQ